MNWVRTGSGIGTAKRGRRVKAAKPAKVKKPPGPPDYPGDIADFPANCYRCGELLLGPLGGVTNRSGIETAETINGVMVRRRECGTNCGATEGAFAE